MAGVTLKFAKHAVGRSKGRNQKLVLRRRDEGSNVATS
jgi:hypothetical protein